MRLIKPVSGVITAGFNDKSALDATHIHGALDYSAIVGTEILACEDGYVFGWCGFRPRPSMYWKTLPKVNNYNKFTFANMFYNMYGGCTLLESLDGKRTHVFCHSFGKQIFEIVLKDVPKHYVEQAESSEEGFVLHGFYTDKIQVKQGQVIGRVGEAGQNLGQHLHHEVHHGINNCETYEKRIDPATLF